MDDALPPPPLPDDVAALKAMVLTLARQRAQARLEAQELEAKKPRLEVELLRLKKLYYGPRADTLASAGEVAQMLLDFATELEARPAQPEDLQADAPPSRGAGGGPRGGRGRAGWPRCCWTSRRSGRPAPPSRRT